MTTAKLKVLIVDDDADLREIISSHLKTVADIIHTANDGQEAVKACRSVKVPYDVLLTDIMLPNQDGIQTILKLRDEFPGMYIIAISGGRRTLTSDFTLQSASLAGAHAVLSKPFTRDQLLGTIRQAGL